MNPTLATVCHGLYVVCTDCENDKIRLRIHSSLSQFGTLRVWTVSLEGSMKCGKTGLDDEENMANVKERETIEERQTKLVNLCCHLHILLMARHINWLGKE